MSKFSLKWHEECLENRKRNLDKKNKELDAMQEEIYRLKVRIIVYEGQIEKARKEGKTEFDAAKFGIKRPKRQTKEN